LQQFQGGIDFLLHNAGLIKRDKF